MQVPRHLAFPFRLFLQLKWSPLVHRAYKPIDFESHFDFATPRKKLYYEILGDESRSMNKATCFNMKKVKKRTRSTAFAVNLSSLSKKKGKKKKAVSQFSPSPSRKGACNSVTKKVWNKMLKAAAKYFKKRRKDSKAHGRLSSVYLRKDIFRRFR